MADFNLKWDGENLLQQIDGACQKAVKAGADLVARDARRLCPKDSGDLAKTIEVKTWERPGVFGAFVKAGGDTMGHIARFVELGTPGTVYKAKSKRGRARTPIRANPFLRPALRKNKAKIIKAFKGIIK